MPTRRTHTTAPWALPFRARRSELNRLADDELTRYGAALAGAGYYDARADADTADAYYRSVDPSRPGGELFRQLSVLVGATHRRKLPYAPSTYLFPWTDLHADRSLRSIYSGRPPADPRPYLTAE